MPGAARPRTVPRACASTAPLRLAAVARSPACSRRSQDRPACPSPLAGPPRHRRLARQRRAGLRPARAARPPRRRPRAGWLVAGAPAVGAGVRRVRRAPRVAQTPVRRPRRGRRLGAARPAAWSQRRALHPPRHRHRLGCCEAVSATVADHGLARRRDDDGSRLDLRTEDWRGLRGIVALALAIGVVAVYALQQRGRQQGPGHHRQRAVAGRRRAR